ncbi:MAG: molybdopterin oxidoreductase family protein, partial [Anaerolineae bacterium]
YRYGSQIHLLLGLIQVILEEGLEDGEFLAARTEGLGGVRQAARAYNPVQVAELTGVPEETLREAARAFAQAQDGVTLFGREALALDDGRALRQALANLLLLTGHVGRANNGLIALLPHNNSRGAADMGLVPYRLPGYAPLDDARARARLEAMWASPPPDDKWSRLSGPGLGAHKMLGGGVKALYVMGADPAAQRPQGLEFLVVQDLFLTETARLADVVLPAASFAEREGTFTNTERRVQRFKQAIRSPGEARADWWIVAEIAKRIKGTQGGWGYASPGQIMDEITRAVPIYGGMSYEGLGAVGRRSALREVYEGMSFENVAGEGCQWPAAAEDPTTRFTLHWLEPQAPHEADESFPFTLVAPRLLFDAGTLIARSQILRPLIPQAQVALNATDARRLGIADGDGVQVTSARGSLELTARLDGQVPQGVVLVPQNLGGAAINQLLGPGVIAAQVRIAKVEG